MFYCFRFFLCVGLFLFSGALQAVVSPSPHKTICLNMIVKNEKDCIERCLMSVLPLIDYWVIVDTGSTDGTMQVIKDFMKAKNVPGELHERPWVNFAHNRNEALELAKGKGEYLFFIDADDYLAYDTLFEHPELDQDYYYVNTVIPGMNCGKVLCINNHLNWKWEGVLHEALHLDPSRSSGVIAKVTNITTLDGARSRDPLKYQKDAVILEAALKNAPGNSRYIFYLAQTYFVLQKYELALQNYEKRIEMGGSDQELFYSLFQIAKVQEAMNMPDDVLIASYKRAFQYRPSRAEPLYQLVHYLRKKGKYALGYTIAKIGLTIPLSDDTLFIERWMYDYGLLLEFSVCAYWMGHYEESQSISICLLQKLSLPPHIRDCIEQNLSVTNAKLFELVDNKTQLKTL